MADTASTEPARAALGAGPLGLRLALGHVLQTLAFARDEPAVGLVGRGHDRHPLGDQFVDALRGGADLLGQVLCQGLLDLRAFPLGQVGDLDPVGQADQVQFDRVVAHAGDVVPDLAHDLSDVARPRFAEDSEDVGRCVRQYGRGRC